MSLIKRILNPYLRLTEKPHLTKSSPHKIRRSFERKAKLLFWGPWGSRYDTCVLEHEGARTSAVTVNADDSKGPVLFYIHGGAYVFGSPRSYRALMAKLSRYTGCPAVLPQYRLAPEHAFPAPIEDVMVAYQSVMHHPGGIVLGGDSAGGGLALALLGEINRLGLPAPRGTFAFSPLVDCSFTAPSITKNAEREVVLPASRASEFADIYLKGAAVDDPRASPLYADFKGAPPVWITVGDTEILLDDSIRMAEALQQQGVDVTLVVEDNLPHIWPIFHNTLPEARNTLQALASWVAALSDSGKR